MKNIMLQDEKREYLSPEMEISLLGLGKDVLCMSNEANDNDFDAGGLGSFGG